LKAAREPEGAGGFIRNSIIHKIILDQIGEGAWVNI